MRYRHDNILILAVMMLTMAGCPSTGPNATGETIPIKIPRGYLPVLEFEFEGRLVRFGPFVGYYLRPHVNGNHSVIDFVCFNERSFYASDMPVNALLFKGRGVRRTLPRVDDHAVPVREGRIRPVFFDEAPAAWLATRPEPQHAFIHFHSCHDAGGALHTGFWLAHKAVAAFTYDMGGRVGDGSILYHQVRPGTDEDFARIVEFDSG